MSSFGIWNLSRVEPKSLTRYNSEGADTSQSAPAGTAKKSNVIEGRPGLFAAHKDAVFIDAGNLGEQYYLTLKLAGKGQPKEMCTA